ncbi:hypothetical protein [Xenorhabdus bovienii]|nr:hypothetical protein [Xenorhabdus bovienii]
MAAIYKIGISDFVGGFYVSTMVVELKDLLNEKATAILNAVA